jgi:type VI protein secretion system component VasK
MIAQLVGIYDVISLLIISILNVFIMYSGYKMEIQDSKFFKIRIIYFIFASLVGLVW